MRKQTMSFIDLSCRETRLGPGTRVGEADALVGKNPAENCLDVAELARVIESAGQLVWAQQGADRGILRCLVPEDQVIFPSPHGMALPEAIRIFAQHSRLRQIKQKLAGENQTAGGLEVPLHPLRVDEKAVDQVCRLEEQVIRQDGRVGENHALDG